MPEKSKVAVGVIVCPNDKGSVLIAKRPDGKVMSGLWEFPGGKVEAGETVELALKRELMEEIGIETTECEPFLDVDETYPDLNWHVSLSVYLVKCFKQKPVGLEGQTIKWCKISDLDSHEFPLANQHIIKKIKKSLPAVI